MAFLDDAWRKFDRSTQNVNVPRYRALNEFVKKELKNPEHLQRQIDAAQTDISAPCEEVPALETSFHPETNTILPDATVSEVDEDFSYGD